MPEYRQIDTMISIGPAISSEFGSTDDGAKTTPAAAGRTIRRRRADAELSYTRIVQAAVGLLEESPSPSVDQVAAAAEVSRATVYRHFKSRNALLRAARGQVTDEALSAGGGHEAGESSRVPGVSELLDQVPPYLLGEQIVAEARRLPGVSSSALYLVDIDGSRLLRFSGSDEFPDQLPAPLAVGPEIPREGIANLRRLIADQLAGSVAAPLHLRGRAIGLLLAVDAEPSRLALLARQAAAALENAESYTDAIAQCRRRKPITAAGEMQQNLLPPRIVQITGATVAGAMLPCYEVGGDWFDYAENSDGAWLAVAETPGEGVTAVSLAALALAALRAARRSGAGHEETVGRMHETIACADSDAVVTAIVGRWQGPTATFSWINCGHLPPVLIGEDGELRVLKIPAAPALGAKPGPGPLSVGTRSLRRGERLVLYCDGVSERVMHDGAPFGLKGIRQAALKAENSSAAATARAIIDAVAMASRSALSDDATLLVLAPTDRPRGQAAGPAI